MTPEQTALLRKIPTDWRHIDGYWKGSPTFAALRDAGLAEDRNRTKPGFDRDPTPPWTWEARLTSEGRSVRKSIKRKLFR